MRDQSTLGRSLMVMESCCPFDRKRRTMAVEWMKRIDLRRIVGVFDTVGSVGLPEEISFHSDKLKSIFGFPDKLLGEHVARAYQALAINETRADFVSRIDYCARDTRLSIIRIVPNTSKQTAEGRKAKCSSR